MFEYEVISNFRIEFSLLVPSKVRFFRNFLISPPIKLKFGTWIQNWMLIIIFGSQSGFGDDLGQYDTQPLFYERFLTKRLIVMATPKIPDNQKLFERVCYMLKLKVKKF